MLRLMTLDAASAEIVRLPCLSSEAANYNYVSNVLTKLQVADRVQASSAPERPDSVRTACRKAAPGRDVTSPRYAPISSASSSLLAGESLSGLRRSEWHRGRPVPVNLLGHDFLVHPGSIFHLLLPYCCHRASVCRLLFRTFPLFCRTFNGAPGRIRTCDRRIRSSTQYVLARTDASGDLCDLQDFRSLRTFGSSAVYQPVPARLQYGCSTSSGSRRKRRRASRITGGRRCFARRNPRGGQAPPARRVI
jgi:hypothetical protein